VKNTNQSSAELAESVIDVQRFSFIPKPVRHKAVIQSLDFNRNSQLMLTCGMDKMIKFFKFKENHMLKRTDMALEKALFVKGCPLKQAKFLNAQNEVLACGTKKFMMLYNIKKDRMTKL